MRIEEIGPKLKSVIAIESADLFESRWSNLLACFSAGDVFGLIGDYFRVEGLPQEVRDDYSIVTVCKATEAAFLELLRRGALDGCVRLSPLPPAAQAELDRMAGVSSDLDAVDDKQAQASARAALIQEAAKDWRSIGSREYRAKWMQTEERRQIHEEALLILEAQDKAIAAGHKATREVRESEANAVLPRNF